MLLFTHIFPMNNTFPHIRINLSHTHSFSSFSFPKKKYSIPLNPSLQSMVSHPSWTNENRKWFSLLWNLGWESLCPMKHEEGFILQSNRMIIFMINGIKGLILFLILDILMGFLSSIIINFVCSTLTSYFFILIILSN